MKPNSRILPSEIRRVYEGRVFRVAVETIKLPNGREVNLDIVRHPGSVVLLPLTEQGELILVRQYRHAVGRWLWELPAGTLEPGERAEDAAARECQEELGLVPARVEWIGSLFPTPGYCDEEMVFFRATGLRAPRADDTPAQPDEDEDIETQAFTIQDVRLLITRGDIIDMKTAAGLLLLEL